MKDMMIIETRDPVQVADVEWSADLLVPMRQAGARCTMVLTENGVLGARAAARTAFLRRLVDNEIAVLADRFALAERGIAESEVAPGVACADLGAVVDALEAGAAVIWR
jgi:hypothetical protein